MHLYLDETQFELGDGRKILGVGALAVAAPISRSVVDAALTALYEDPDRDPANGRRMAKVEAADCRTSSKGFFHASFDSQNGHSHLARAIKSYIRGEFASSFSVLATNRDSETQLRGHSMNAVLSSLKLREATTCVFEQRSKLTPQTASAAIEWLYRGIDWSTYELPLLRSYYPKVDVVIGTKQDAGLQVADLLLWSLVQMKFFPHKKSSKIAGWCGMSSWASMENSRATEYSFDCTVNQSHGDSTSDAAAYTAYPVPFAQLDLGVDNHLLAEIYCFIERTVRACAAAAVLSEHSEYLRAGLHGVLRKLARAKHTTPDDVRLMVRQYLRLVDMVPLHHDFVPDDDRWLLLARAKRFGALTLRTDLIHGVRTSIYFAKVRDLTLRASPHVLGL